MLLHLVFLLFLCLFVDILSMCMLYVSLGSSVTPNIWGGGGYVHEECCLFVLYSAGSGDNSSIKECMRC